MLMTTLCYIEHEDHYLLLHRTKKEQDINEGKWIGVGGKFLDRESPEECLLREVKEETGYTLTRWRFRGIVTFLQENYETEFMCLYTADDFLLPSGRDQDRADESRPELTDAPAPSRFLQIPVGLHPGFLSAPSDSWPVPRCSEGELAWVSKANTMDLPLWEGDRIFLRLLQEDRPFFSLRLEYKGDDLLHADLDGKALDLNASACL